MSEKMNIPSEKNFKLSKVKLVPDGGLEAQYQVNEVVGNETYMNEYHVKDAKEIHPDLKSLFRDLKPVVGRVLGVTSFLSFLEGDDIKLTEAKMKSARAFANELLSNIEVRGISFSGEDENVGVIITSIFTTSNGLKTCINTPRIKLANISFGFEEELESICGQVEQEVYEFLFKGKKAQLSLFGDGTETEQND